jgi:hypothetical protein
MEQVQQAMIWAMWVVSGVTTCKRSTCEEVCRLHRSIFKKLILTVVNLVVADQPWVVPRRLAHHDGLWFFVGCGCLVCLFQVPNAQAANKRNPKIQNN